MEIGSEEAEAAYECVIFRRCQKRWYWAPIDKQAILSRRVDSLMDSGFTSDGVRLVSERETQ